MAAEKRITYKICVITYVKCSENRIMDLSVAYCAERHTLSLNQCTSLISKHFCKTEGNSVSKRKTR